MNIDFNNFAATFASIIAVISFFGYLLITFGQWQEKMKSLDKFDAKFDKLNERIDSISTRISAFEGFFNRIERSLTLSEPQNPYAESNSPIALNKKGEELAKELDAEALVSKHWEKIYKVIDEAVKTQNPYDIQQFCFKYADDFTLYMPESELDKIKKIAFDRGENVLQYGIVFGIIMRNNYFREKGIELTSIDTHTPKK